MKERPSPQPTAERIALTEELIARKGTDKARWARPDSLATQWDSRAKIAADLIGPGAPRVLDIGAGAMALTGFLPPQAAYVPADVARRSDDCHVVDLNAGEFPPGAYDVVSFLGVLEYIHDPAWPLRKATEAAPLLIVSYCTETGQNTAYRRGLGWVNDFTRDGFEALLRANGWAPVERVEYKRSAMNVQYVWKCRRAEAS